MIRIIRWNINYELTTSRLCFLESVGVNYLNYQIKKFIITPKQPWNLCRQGLKLSARVIKVFATLESFDLLLRRLLNSAEKNTAERSEQVRVWERVKSTKCVSWDQNLKHRNKKCFMSHFRRWKVFFHIVWRRRKLSQKDVDRIFYF
jgi:hypothetical protein